MSPMVFGLGTTELLIILALALLIFGGTRLAGLGKSSGRAIREFKEETKGLTEAEKAEKAAKDGKAGGATQTGAIEGGSPADGAQIHDAQIVEPETHGVETPKNDLR